MRHLCIVSFQDIVDLLLLWLSLLHKPLSKHGHLIKNDNNNRKNSINGMMK